MNKENKNISKKLISCEKCKYGEKHDYLNTFYCNNKQINNATYSDQPEKLNCPYGALKYID